MGLGSRLRSLLAHSSDTSASIAVSASSGKIVATHEAGSEFVLGPELSDGSYDIDVASLQVQGRVNQFVGQGGGWRDMIGLIESRGSGPTFPAWSVIPGTIYSGYKFAIDDLIQVNYHLQHDTTPGAGNPIYFHAHWISDGTNVNPVKWEFSWAYARGYGQDAFPLASPTVDVIAESTDGTPYQHMISELALPATFANLEVDGIILCRLRRITNGATENTDGIYLLTSDAHYQCDTTSTLNRSPNPSFYE